MRPHDLAAAFASCAPVADAVLREGQVLFPYRASALKNRFRWQWGVLAPPDWARAHGSERSSVAVECVADVRAGASVAARVRFVHLQARSVEAGDGCRPPLDHLVVGDTTWSSYEEAIDTHVDLGPVAAAKDGGGVATLHVPILETASTSSECLATAAGESGVLARRRREVSGLARMDIEPVSGPWSLAQVRVTVENTTPWSDPAADRDDALLSSLVAVHVMLAVDKGAWISSVDPPEFARPAVAACQRDGLWPAVVGLAGGIDVVLAAPIILPDRPTIAPLSLGETCDATEIDEMLTLSVIALGDDEQGEARGTDPVAAAIIDGALRAAHDGQRILDLHTAPASAPELSVDVDGTNVGRGSRVRLRPRSGADAQDLFVDGLVAVVEAVIHDVDGRVHVAVTIEDDPGADLHRRNGRYRYFAIDEIEPLGAHR